MVTRQIKTVHLEESTTRISEDTPIVRYMKLETLLLMLEGGYVFLPSYAKLGQNDPLETKILLNLPDRWKFWEKYADKLEPRFAPFRDTLIFNDIPAWHRHKTKAELVKSDYGSYVDYLTWNRCVWCWNKFKNFSYALWQIYGIRGVAVRSTVRLVKAALFKADVGHGVEGIVAPISYIDHAGKGIPKILTQEENLLRPYLMKSVFYKYENEVRFVCAATCSFSGFMQNSLGVLIPVNAADFVQHIDYSPHFHDKEKSAVREVVESLRSARHIVNREPLVESDIFWGTSLTGHARGQNPSPDLS